MITNKQKGINFKGLELTTRKGVNSILRVYQEATSKEMLNFWYNDAHKYGLKLQMLAYNKNSYYTIAQTLGVIAALSPLKSWDENMRIAKSFILGGSSYHTKIMTSKARAILDSDGSPEAICDILGGNKITRFFLNMLYPHKDNIATIDRHAIAVVLGRSASDKEAQLTNKQYLFFENCYIIAAQKLDINTNNLQAITWEAWRRLKKEGEVI